MRSRLGFILDRTGHNLEESGTDVLLEWIEWPAGTQRDAVDGGAVSPDGGTPQAIPRSNVVKGFPHFPQPTANSTVRQFNEVEAGDMMLDLDPATRIDGLEGLTFLLLTPDGLPVDGIKWVPKPISDRLARTWATVSRGTRIFRTVLLRKQTANSLTANGR